MSSRKFSHAVVIGRFQPIHEGHRTLFNKAFELADKVIVVCGSANQARTVKNPWNIEERERMISLALGEDASRLVVKGISDYHDDIHWAIKIQKTVDNVVFNSYVNAPSVVLVGHKKDESSFYLDMFPQWSYEEVSQEGPLDATDVRELYFHYQDELFQKAVQNVLCEPVKKFLASWKHSDHYLPLQEEWNFIIDYHTIWKFAPYAPTFVTTDAVVIESGHILLIQRGANPGKGLWALPGGFIDPGDKTLEDCAVRELHEETGLKVPKKVLKGSITNSGVFEEAGRDPRGRFVTHAFLFELVPCPDPTKKLTPVKGGDDAAHAQWIPLSQLKKLESEFFLDHFRIIQEMIGGLY